MTIMATTIIITMLIVSIFVMIMPIRTMIDHGAGDHRQTGS
jgi:hypothetical protein